MICLSSEFIVLMCRLQNVNPTRSCGAEFIMKPK